MKSTAELRLGILGMSEGNGHPYSWSAIFNGYDPAVMASCPFPVIPAYLADQVFPRDAIPGARVTHVWVQDRSAAEHVAAASRISTVVDSYEEMIGHVDAVLLARDDAEHHLEMSIPFLDAGLPVYIDKPVALTLGDLAMLYRHQRHDAQIFSCSPMRFAEELRLDEQDRSALGEIRHVQAIVPKSWEKYGMHVIDPVLSILDVYGADCDVTSTQLEAVRVVTADWGRVSATFTCMGPTPCPIKIGIYGSGGSTELTFKNSFLAFKRSLEAFLDQVRSGREITTRSELTSAVSIVERGMMYGK